MRTWSNGLIINGNRLAGHFLIEYQTHISNDIFVAQSDTLIFSKILTESLCRLPIQRFGLSPTSV